MNAEELRQRANIRVSTAFDNTNDAMNTMRIRPRHLSLPDLNNIVYHLTKALGAAQQAQALEEAAAAEGMR